MSCDFPIECRFWDSKERKCKLSLEEFQELCEKGRNPCETHQRKIDATAEREFIKAYNGNDDETMKTIVSSPFTNFGKRRR
ncbi:MAG: hypothetical protein FHOMOCKG_00019 [Methanophagales virus GBV302]|mgnify:FL=1|uniref:Uncharacterized protein n=1 Tax=Methanophagales virus GBV302 TaxID=2999281 RepID=A0A9E8VFC2_9CAUD|nr:MAG: hypothetical protein QIT37_gp019 [Methanophagales virus GBV302]WAE39547.1 MAG: hypothetical protein FHOMOCKG_00019 [Methanophagales virus GBV302]